MPEDSFQERTEQATPKRRQEAREKGNVYKSVEINSIFVLLVSLILFFFVGGKMVEQISSVMRAYFARVSQMSFTLDTIGYHVEEFIGHMGAVFAPMALALFLAGLTVNVAQVGFVLAGESIQPQFSRISPRSGLKRIFSARSIVELLKGLFKLLIVTWLLYVTIRGNLPRLIATVEETPAEILGFLGSIMFQTGWKIVLILIVLAVFDYAFQRWDYEKNLRMTRQEVKEELKQTEGDPIVKSRIRSVQREMARKRMLTKVPEADVVIVNPTSLAIALKYDPEVMSAPRVLAKGARLVADQIRKIAEEHNVPIVEDKPLAQALYKVVEAGDEIPYQFYKAVAEILAYVYKLKKE